MKLPSVARLLRANVVMAAASFLTSVALARTLEPEARGHLANVVLWPTFLAQIALFGVPVYLSRELVARRDLAVAYYRQGYAALIVSCVAALVGYGALYAAVGTPIALGFAGALSAAAIIPFSAWNAMQVQMELGRNHIRNFNFARGSFTLSYLVCVTALWALNSRDVDFYLWAFILAAAFAAIASHRIIARSLTQLPPVEPEHVQPAATLLGTFRASVPFAASISLIALATSADRIAISLFFDAQTLGVYVVALALSQVQSVVNEAVAPLFFTSLAQKDHVAHTGPAWLATRLRQSIVINAGICAGLIVAAPILLPLIYGPKYEMALPLVSLLLPAMCIRSMMRPFEEVLKGLNRPLGQSIAIAVITIVFFAGAAAAAWFGSISGVTLAMLAASSAGLATVAVLVSREKNIGLLQLLVPRPGDFWGLVAEVRRIVVQRRSAGA